MLIPQVIDAPDAFQAAGRLEDGIPAIRVPDYGNGIVDIPGNYAFADYPKNFRRGYLQSWNIAVQRQLGQGFTAEVAYVATRETNKLPIWKSTLGQ